MRWLDLFCGAGGAGAGFARCGLEVVGVDIEPQPNYPYDFIQADALKVLAQLLAGQAIGPSREGRYYRLEDFVGIHASPPCQAYSPLNAYNKREYPDLVEPVRQLLMATGLPYVIENVPQAPLLNPITLCGPMFGLRVYRHRAFESSMPLMCPPHVDHVARCARNGYTPTAAEPFMSIHGGKHSKEWQRAAAEALEVPWMSTIREVCESIPPAYTEFVGAQIRDQIVSVAA